MLVTRVDDPITPVIADDLAGIVDAAQKARYQAVIVELDTPGGLDSAVREIVQVFLAARVPVVVHVSPPGRGRPPPAR